MLDNTTPIGLVLRSVMRNWNITRVTVFTDVESALRSVEQRPPDILFVNGNGTLHDMADTVRTIRNPGTFAEPYVAIIVALSEVTRERVTTARDAGADEFLAVPFSAKNLHDRISSIVYDRRGFVSVPTYFGPDRRRGAMAEYLGTNRRSTPSMLIDPATRCIFLEDTL